MQALCKLPSAFGKKDEILWPGCIYQSAGLSLCLGPKDKKTSEQHDLKARDDSGWFDEAVEDP